MVRSTAPVGSSIGALLDGAIHSTTVSEAGAVPVGLSIAVSTEPVFQETITTAEEASQDPTDEIASSPSEATAATATTGAAAVSLAAPTVTVAEGPHETSWRPALQVDGVTWPSIQGRLQTAAAAAMEQMSDGLASLCASGSKVLGLASCAAARASPRFSWPPLKSSWARAGKWSSSTPTGTIRKWPKAWA